MNKVINEVYSQIVDILNESHLPVGVGLLILKDIYNDLDGAFKEAIKNEGDPERREEILSSDDLEVRGVEEIIK